MKVVGVDLSLELLKIAQREEHLIRSPKGVLAHIAASGCEGIGKWPTLKEDDAVSRHVGDESRIPFLQAA